MSHRHNHAPHTPEQLAHRQRLAAAYRGVYQRRVSPAEPAATPPVIAPPLPVEQKPDPTVGETIADIKPTPKQIAEYLHLMSDGMHYLDAKVATGEIKKLNRYERSYLMNKYVETYTDDPELVQFARAKEAKIPARAEHDFKVKERRLKHKIRDAHEKAVLYNRLFTVGKIIAIAAATFAAPIGGPAIAAALSVPGSVGAGLAAAAACGAADAACQGIGLGLGIQDHFSTNELIETTFGAGFGAGAAQAGLGFTGRAVATAIGSGLAQEVEIQAGSRDKRSEIGWHASRFFTFGIWSRAGNVERQRCDCKNLT